MILGRVTDRRAAFYAKSAADRASDPDEWKRRVRLGEAYQVHGWRPIPRTIPEPACAQVVQLRRRS